MNEMNVFQEPVTTLMQPDGDLVAACLPALRSKLREIVGTGVFNLTIDLAPTKMVDSAGIGLLISTHNTLRKAGGELKVVNASKDIYDLLRTMRIHQHFSVSGLQAEV